jgi:hypothetical protein
MGQLLNQIFEKLEEIIMVKEVEQERKEKEPRKEGEHVGK